MPWCQNCLQNLLILHICKGDPKSRGQRSGEENPQPTTIADNIELSPEIAKTPPKPKQVTPNARQWSGDSVSSILGVVKPGFEAFTTYVIPMPPKQPMTYKILK